MSSKVIKFVAGGGKTTYSKKLMSKTKNGLYLAFTNSVVEEMSSNGFLSKTIDSLFASFIIPKFVDLIPIINSSSNIKYFDKESPNDIAKAASNISFTSNGEIYNKGKKIYEVSLNSTNGELHKLNYFKNSRSIKYIFDIDSTRLTHQQRGQISEFIIHNYPKELSYIMSKRFSFIIFDEAQDLSGYREKFCSLLYSSNVSLRILGDDYQNINNGGVWFEKLSPSKINNLTYRCSDVLCEWIRRELDIDIQGVSRDASVSLITLEKVLNYDDGKRVLLYKSRIKKLADTIDNWHGRTQTIQSAKGNTIDSDIVIIGDSLSKKNMYTAITRTTKSAYYTIKRIN
ncbi:UvrD-helicase domain-containing protein [Hujiaoplasma nucleasis]|uniref:UvrD-helicase domain-containing protein n=1 Tax=Hujiaoplasma nucleasis TaxID=2725268 RepID=A0A7L6N6I5_9MOLU|nr:UvrD-helicase domain-containing protein [Hujiaoplasma nucleasis]QLY40605.1 UvrD-helicase domain-containing protein [Hujiaoplasma nucleasis]